MICAAYGENAVSHTTCKRWYQLFRQGDFSLEDEPRAGRPQKIETDELQALLDINSAQTEKELAEQLGVTQQIISIRLHTMEKVQKEGKWFRMNCPKTTKIVGVTLHSLCFQSSGKKIFCTKSLQAMKSGFFMITLNVENHGLTLFNLRH
ncbi:hypothetical protein P5V15_002684 [Pogonomyrmex californicus]